jgi:RNA polymerase sigma-70 factor, ECF subfamily
VSGQGGLAPQGITPIMASLDAVPNDVRHLAGIPDTPARTDEELLREYLLGNRQSFALLVHRYEKELFRFLVRFLGDRQSAEDVFQETFMQVHQSAAQFDPQRRFRPWLFTIAANKARDLLRSQSRKHTSPLEASVDRADEESSQYVDLMQGPEALPSTHLEQEELQQLVQKTVKELPPALREVILLAYFHQFPYKQIGEMLGIPLGTVKSRLHAAIATFSEHWRRIPANKTAR